MWFPRFFLLFLLLSSACLFGSFAYDPDCDGENQAKKKNGMISLELAPKCEKVQALLLTNWNKNISFSVMRPEIDLYNDVYTIGVIFSYSNECMMSWKWSRNGFQVSKGNRPNQAGINSKALVVLDSRGKSFIKGKWTEESSNEQDIDPPIYEFCNLDLSPYDSSSYLLNFSMHYAKEDAKGMKAERYRAIVNFDSRYRLMPSPKPSTSSASATVSSVAADSTQKDTAFPLYAIIIVSICVPVILLSLVFGIWWCVHKKAEDKKLERSKKCVAHESTTTPVLTAINTVNEHKAAKTKKFKAAKSSVKQTELTCQEPTTISVATGVERTKTEKSETDAKTAIRKTEPEVENVVSKLIPPPDRDVTGAEKKLLEEHRYRKTLYEPIDNFGSIADDPIAEKTLDDKLVKPVSLSKKNEVSTQNTQENESVDKTPPSKTF